MPDATPGRGSRATEFWSRRRPIKRCSEGKSPSVRGVAGATPFPTKQARAVFVDRRLAELYPETPIPLTHKDAYSLLVAVVLSAQSTDVGVNKVTPLLWALGSGPAQIAEVPVEKIR